MKEALVGRNLPDLKTQLLAIERNVLGQTFGILKSKSMKASPSEKSRCPMGREREYIVGLYGTSGDDMAFNLTRVSTV